MRIAASFVGAQIIALWTLLGPIANEPWLQGFRGYFANDQMSYAAIATTVANGLLTPVEPLTQTGVSHYPSAWYIIVGLASMVTGLPVYAAWQVLGLIGLGVSLALLGIIGFRLTRNALTPLLPALAIMTGTLSVTMSDTWFTSLQHHAVIWGPFGTLFTLNAEAIGVMVTAVIFTWLVARAMKRNSPSESMTTPIIVSAIVSGTLANVQTYAFLTVTSLLASFLAAYALITLPNVRRLFATLTLVGLILLTGPFVAAAVGPLPLFALLLLATLPASWPLLRSHVVLTAVTLSAFVLAASPQVVRVLTGLLQGDDFLTYRQESTQDLSVPVLPLLMSALPMIALSAVLLIAALAQQRGREGLTLIASLVALWVGAAIMSTNSVWGFSQEPYRFWLQYSIVGLFFLATLLPWAWSRSRQLHEAPARGVAALTISVALLWVVSLMDVWAFRQDAQTQAIIDLETDYTRALSSLVGPTSELTLASACTDPQFLRLATSAPVAFFNRGLAWPDHRVEIDSLMKSDPSQAAELPLLAAAGVQNVITDSACVPDWSFGDARVQPLKVADYDGGFLTLWQVSTGP